MFPQKWQITKQESFAKTPLVLWHIRWINWRATPFPAKSRQGFAKRDVYSPYFANLGETLAGLCGKYVKKAFHGLPVRQGLVKNQTWFARSVVKKQKWNYGMESGLASPKNKAICQARKDRACPEVWQSGAQMILFAKASQSWEMIFI